MQDPYYPKLSKRMTLGLTISIWNELAFYGGNLSDKDWIAGKYGEFENSCPLCEYVKQNPRQYCDVGKGCLIKWADDEMSTCVNYSSPYKLWTRVTSIDSKQYFAKEVVQLGLVALERVGWDE